MTELVTDGPLILGFFVAALAGLISFASPCVVPLVPGYMSYLASIVGGSVNIVDGRAVINKKTHVAAAALLFVLGFTTIFLLATVSIFGAINTITLNATWLQKIGGIITILMGLTFMGALPWLQNPTRIAPKKLSTWLGAPLLGAIFALGWTPCLGPTLASIISISVGTQGATAARGAFMVIGYCLGLGLPFILFAIFSTHALNWVNWLGTHTRTIQLIGGIALVLVGCALLTGLWDHVVGFFRQLSMNPAL